MFPDLFLVRAKGSFVSLMAEVILQIFGRGYLDFLKLFSICIKVTHLLITKVDGLFLCELDGIIIQIYATMKVRIKLKFISK